jgi:hypothetical protein
MNSLSCLVSNKLHIILVETLSLSKVTKGVE